MATYSNKISGPLIIRNVTDDELSITLEDKDGMSPDTVKNEVSIKKSAKKLGLHSPDKVEVNIAPMGAASTYDSELFRCSYNGDLRFTVDNAGIVKATGGFQQTCLRSAKDNIEAVNIDDVLKFIDNVDIKTFTYKSGDANGISVIIDELIEAEAPLLDYVLSKDQSSVNLNNMIGILLAGLKEERSQRLALENRLSNIEDMLMKGTK